MGKSSYPIVLTDIDVVPCLVVGGGAVAERKIAALLEAYAQVIVVSPRVTATIQRWADDGQVRLLDRAFKPDDIAGCALVIAATNERQVNAAIARTARAMGVLVNVVDDPAAGMFITPATLRRGDLLLGITTNGVSPVVASLVRRTLERTIGDEYQMLLDLLGSLREDMREAIPQAARAALMRALATDEMLEWLRTGQHERVSAFVTEQVALVQEVAVPIVPPTREGGRDIGRVSFVGAGPGDAGLLTVKGMQLLGNADAVVYDDIADTAILEHCASFTKRYHLGRRTGKHDDSQESIGDLLVALARQGMRVVRLKAGDPFMFTRGDEEASVLDAHAVPWDVVPGVCAGYAAPALLGIALTHRQWSSSVAFVSGQSDPGGEPRVVDWHGLATSVDTIVIFMGVRHLRSIAAQLIAGGRDPATPVAVIEYATHPSQRSLVATLASIGDAAARAQICAPAITVVGEVVGARLHAASVNEYIDTDVSAVESWGENI